MNDEFDEKIAEQWFEDKTSMMVGLLGEEHDMVMHAIIPFALGGGLDLYYFPNGIEGTAIATKELTETPGEGSHNDVLNTYELVMFTRHPLSMDDAQDEETPFGKVHATINVILNCMARYSEQAILNPNETCEFPEDMESVGGKCLIMDSYGFEGDQAEFGLMVLIEVFPSEMNYARKNGGRQLLDKLKEAGHYPYSDLDRTPVA